MMITPLIRESRRKIFSYLPTYSPWFQYRELQKSQFFSPKEIQDLKLRNLQRLYKYACRETRLYSFLFRKNIIPNSIRTFEDLKHVPLLTKKIASLVFPPSNLSLSAFYHRNWLDKGTTSGTTGKPFIYYHDLIKKAKLDAFNLRGRGWAGYRFRDYYGWLIPMNPPKSHLTRFLSKITDQHSKRIKFPSNILSPAILQRYIEIIKNRNIKYIEGYVLPLGALAKHVIDNNINLELNSVKVGAGMLFPQTRRFFEEALQCEVFESYGSAEFGNMALECEEHSGLHIYESTIIEVLRDGESVIDEEGDIVITDLTNYAQPFIRYQIGDRGILSEEKCNCGRSLTILREIQGRANDAVLSPSGIWMSPSAFAYIIEPLKEVIQWQIRQETRKDLLVRLVIRYFNPELEPIIRSGIIRLDPGFEIAFEFLEEIPKGKMKCIVSPFKPREDLIL